jgi:hypothetical protein
VVACRAEKFVRQDAGQNTLEACAPLNYGFAEQLVFS